MLLTIQYTSTRATQRITKRTNELSIQYSITITLKNGGKNKKKNSAKRNIFQTPRQYSDKYFRNIVKFPVKKIFFFFFFTKQEEKVGKFVPLGSESPLFYGSFFFLAHMLRKLRWQYFKADGRMGAARGFEFIGGVMYVLI